MDFELSEIDFLNSSIYDIKCFADAVNEGTIKESEIKEIFEKVKSKKYTEEEVTELVIIIIFASFIIPNTRVDYHVYSNEALLYVLSFVDIKGSANLKILYLLFPYIIGAEEDEDKNRRYYFKTNVPREINTEYCERLYRLTLVYDCGSVCLLKFINFETNMFKLNFKQYMEKIFKNVIDVLIVISHTDEDHINLLPTLTNFLTKLNTNLIYIKGDEEELENLFENNHAFKSTLNNLINKYYKNKNEGLYNIFSDVILHLIPQHGSITNESYIWTKNIMKISKYPREEYVNDEDIDPKECINDLKKYTAICTIRVITLSSKLNEIRERNYI
ncbi:hypothetical protein PIROE2DRAFT_5456 [Piromyces sp. E2]|nr:hypothetical protein PIROE2DRAFT_5456 [Piromyces sp. E2]|eukprot:OUM67188.1 hypothetical protein PIROE2DRAFT_5456 [Piromyces sp. E2]